MNIRVGPISQESLWYLAQSKPVSTSISKAPCHSPKNHSTAGVQAIISYNGIKKYIFFILLPNLTGAKVCNIQIRIWLIMTVYKIISNIEQGAYYPNCRMLCQITEMSSWLD